MVSRTTTQSLLIARSGFGHRIPGMTVAVCIITLLLLGLAVTGHWRVMLRPFCIREPAMTVDRLGFVATDDRDIERIHGVCHAFAGGFNRRVASQSPDDWRGFVDDLPELYRPFGEEGAAMGFPLRALWGFSPTGFESAVVEPRSMYCYLHYVGLGFWAAMRRQRPKRLADCVSQLDPLHGMLCWDGYGFKFGFFNDDRQQEILTRFRDLPGYAANVAHQGYGRSLWFRFMGEHDRLFDAVRATGPFANDTASGVGLAMAFTMIDRLDRIMGVLEEAPIAWRADIAQGMTFAFKARQLAAPEAFDRWIANQPADRIRCIHDALDACDAIEARIRRGQVQNAYESWRAELNVWLAENIEFPFVARRHAEETLPAARPEPVFLQGVTQ